MINPTQDPVDCPHCGQRVQLYRRRLSTGMVSSLVRLYAATRGADADNLDPDKMFRSESGALWVHKDVFCDARGSGDYAKMRFWQLIVPRDYRSKDDNAAGFWAITELGIDFVERRTRVPLYVYVYNNLLHSVSPDTLGLHDVSAFDYHETLNLESA